MGRSEEGFEIILDPDARKELERIVEEYRLVVIEAIGTRGEMY